MKTHVKRQGPRTHRIMIYFFSTLLALLLVWLLGFILSDIGRIPGPNRAEIEKKYVGQDLYDQLNILKKEAKNIQTQRENQREIQDILGTSTSNSEQTMNQLLEVHRLNLEKGVKPTEAEQEAMAESQALLLENQKKFQEANRQIAALSERQREVKGQIDSLQEDIDAKKKPSGAEYQQLRQRHLFKIASIKLAFLVPLFLAVAWMAIKARQGAYAPVVYAAFIALFWKIGVVMHDHFPREFFKYIAIGAAIVIVLAFLIHLIRTIAAPQRDWLLKQYKEAYNRHRCPVCAYPIERGPFKHAVWTAKGPKLLGSFANENSDTGERPYTCPSCGEGLYETCEKCKETRPSLLPYCPDCGNEKNIAEAS